MEANEAMKADLIERLRAMAPDGRSIVCNGRTTRDMSKDITEAADELAALRERNERLDAEVERWHSAYIIAHDQARANGSSANALRERFALFDAALVDDPGDICAGISEDAIWAGVEAWQQADREMNEYVSGVSTDWDEGMIVAAIFKTVARAILSTPKQEAGREG